jgi:hypothetical protein
MALRNLGNNDYHIYEVYDNNINTISPEGSSSGCNPETVRRVSACAAGIRKNFDEDAGTAIPVDSDGFQTGVGQVLNVQMMPGVPMQLGSAFAQGDPTWDKEYTSVTNPGDPRESVAFWIKEKFAATAGESLDNDHAGKIADRYLQLGRDYEAKINKSGKAKLIDKDDKAAYIFKCKDFAMRVFRMYYGIDKIQPRDYYLTSQIWLSPLLVTTKSGKGRINITINTTGGEEKICCIAAIFINRKDKPKNGLEGSFKVRISELVADGDFDAIKAKFAANISASNASYTSWANALATHISLYHTAPPNLATHTGEDTFIANIGISPEIPGVIGFKAAFSYGAEGSKNGRTSFRFKRFDIGVNPYAAANVIAQALFAARNQALALEAAQRAAQKVYADTMKGQVVAAGPATPTTNTTINLDQPVAVTLPSREDISTPTANVGNTGSTVPNNFSPGVVQD